MNNPKTPCPPSWASGPDAFRRRVYSDYAEYLAHQASKLERLNLSQYDVQYRSALRERLDRLNVLRRGNVVLCLGARIGTECKALIDMGCFAVGVDLNPGPANQYVVHGDFHQLQFATESVDYVFTNSLDHAFDLERVVAEITRILKPGGGLLAEIVGGSKDIHGREPGDYESLWWDNARDVVAVITGNGLSYSGGEQFSYPWNGELMLFRRSRTG